MYVWEIGYVPALCWCSKELSRNPAVPQWSCIEQSLSWSIPIHINILFSVRDCLYFWIQCLSNTISAAYMYHNHLAQNRHNPNMARGELGTVAMTGSISPRWINWQCEFTIHSIIKARQKANSQSRQIPSVFCICLDSNPSRALCWQNHPWFTVSSSLGTIEEILYVSMFWFSATPCYQFVSFLIASQSFKLLYAEFLPSSMAQWLFLNKNKTNTK